MSLYAPSPDKREAFESHYPNSDQTQRESGREELYTFRLVATRKLMHIRIIGFWTLETVADFTRDLHAAVATLGCKPTDHLICCNVTDSAIQPQEVIAALGSLIINGPTTARRMALFTTRPLSRMQSRRLMAARANIAVFESESAALAWITADRG